MVLKQKTTWQILAAGIVMGIVGVVGILGGVLMLYNAAGSCPLGVTCDSQAADQSLNSASLVVHAGNIVFYIGLAFSLVALLRVIYSAIKK